MRRLIPAAVAVLVAAMITAAGAARASTMPPTPPSDDNDHLFVIGSVTIPTGTPGSLEIVLEGTTDGSSVPMILRNNTDQTVYNVGVEGLARDAAGGLVSSGSSLEMEPSTLAPGDWAMGEVYFDFDVLTGEETFLFQTSSDPDAGFLGSIGVTISEASINQGSFSLTAVGVLINEGSETVGGPIGVTVACFDDTDALVGIETGYGEADEVTPGGFTSFSVDLYDIDACPNAALSASGYNL